MVTLSSRQLLSSLYCTQRYIHHHIHKDLPKVFTSWNVSDIMPNTSVATHRHFGGTHRLLLQGKTFNTAKMNTAGSCKMLVPIHQTALLGAYTPNCTAWCLYTKLHCLVPIHQTALHDMLQAHYLSVHYRANFRSQLQGGKCIFLRKNLTHMKQYEK